MNYFTDTYLVHNASCDECYRQLSYNFYILNIYINNMGVLKNTEVISSRQNH